jgi:hypothetical protein
MIARGTSCCRPGLIQGVILLLAASTVAAQYTSNPYAVILDDPAVVSRFPSKPPRARTLFTSNTFRRQYGMSWRCATFRLRDRSACF